MSTVANDVPDDCEAELPVTPVLLKAWLSFVRLINEGSGLDAVRPSDAAAALLAADLLADDATVELICQQASARIRRDLGMSPTATSPPACGTSARHTTAATSTQPSQLGSRFSETGCWSLWSFELLAPLPHHLALKLLQTAIGADSVRSNDEDGPVRLPPAMSALPEQHDDALLAALAPCAISHSCLRLAPAAPDSLDRVTRVLHTCPALTRLHFTLPASPGWPIYPCLDILPIACGHLPALQSLHITDVTHAALTALETNVAAAHHLTALSIAFQEPSVADATRPLLAALAHRDCSPHCRRLGHLALASAGRAGPVGLLYGDLRRAVLHLPGLRSLDISRALGDPSPVLHALARLPDFTSLSLTDIAFDSSADDDDGSNCGAGRPAPTGRIIVPEHLQPPGRSSRFMLLPEADDAQPRGELPRPLAPSLRVVAEEEHLRRLAAGICCMAGLRDLKLAGVKCARPTRLVAALAEHLEVAPLLRLTHLDLSGSLSAVSVTAVDAMLRPLPLLRRLVLQGFSRDFIGETTIPRLNLTRLTALTHLDVRASDMNMTDVSIAAPDQPDSAPRQGALLGRERHAKTPQQPLFSNLRELKVDFCFLSVLGYGPEGLARMWNVLHIDELSQAFPSLTSLLIASTATPDAGPGDADSSRPNGVGSFMRALACMNGNPTMQKIGSEVSRMPKLAELRIEHVQIYPSEFADLVTHVGYGELEVPRASESPPPSPPVEPGVPQRLQDSDIDLRPFQALLHLSLCHTGLEDDGMEHVARMLAHLPRLTHLDLSYNSLNIAGAKELAAALAGGADVDDAAPCAGTGAAAGLAALQILNLRNSLQHRQCVLEMEGALARLGALRTVDMRARQMGGEDERQACACSLQRLQAAKNDLRIRA
eukprot:jgi/Ulvmu1/1759/UM117_0036.1